MDGNRQYPYNGETSHEAEITPDMISIEQLQHLVRLLDRSDVSEVELKRPKEGTRLVLRKVKVADTGDHGEYQNVASIFMGTGTAVPAKTEVSVVAPLVGIFHTWAKPRGGSLVAVGDRIKVGQLVATIQSLNVINEVESPVAGRVTEILIQDGQPVEYGQQLMIIDSREGA
jgi:biotin carboxyl carrier protein